MFFKRRPLIAVILLCVQLLLCAVTQADSPDLLLARSYQSGIDVQEFWVSEKYDGFRAYWDGKQLITRQGNVYAAPLWFTEHFPKTPMDGELWVGRQGFETVASIVRQKTPHDGWRRVIYKVFDLPAAAGSFDQRLPLLQTIIAEAEVPWLQAVEQWRVASEEELYQQLETIVTEGAEGLMLHRGNSLYRAGRHDDLIKLKQSQDAEASVVGYRPGKGKYTGMMGALVVEMPSGQRFRIGSGFSDQERREPPPIGSVITYQYNGLTQRGIPRFARFLRVRVD
ncbi:DNA ligase [Pseudomaricurvus sp.]|uniref:DNA ligase n=1 Tax=Pseudomaricurvus sp. TaxID=2004510 RepID=UPI003F6AAB33